MKSIKIGSAFEMPWLPKLPLTPQTPSCPYCYDGHVTWNEHSKIFHCSHCQVVVQIPNWPEGNGKSTSNGNGQSNGHSNGHKK